MCVNVLLTTLALTVTTRTTVQSIVLKKPVDVLMEFAVQMVEPAIITLQLEGMSVNVYHRGYLHIVVEDQLNHVLVILVKIMEHVYLMDLIILAVAFLVSTML